MATNRIQRCFTEHRAAGRPAVMPFVTAGFPSLECTTAVLPALSQAGAGIIEVGIPFSDPIADGPVIAASMHDALVAGCTPAKVFETIAAVRSQVHAGLAGMVSTSIVHAMGVDAFTQQAAAAGLDGLIVPDMDLHDAPALRKACDARNLTCTFLVAPTSGPERVKRIAELCSGFVYGLARVGITGERTDAPDAKPVVDRIRAHTTLPVAVGFGISTAAHVRDVGAYADGVIVGSSLVRRMQDAHASGHDAAAAAVAFVKTLMPS